MTRSRAAGAVTTKCLRCAAPIVTELVGKVAALQVTADLTPLTREQEQQVRTDRNRLTWCYRTSKYGTPRLTWRDPQHTPHCTHTVVADHTCTGPAPAAHTTPAATLF